MSSNCIFCNIANHNESAAIIYEDDAVVIFLDKRPLFHGHCLLIPRKHFSNLTDLPASLVSNFFTQLQKTSGVVEEAMQAQGTFVAINNKVSQSVPHLHAHIVPRSKGDGLKGFFWPRQTYQGDELRITQQKLCACWVK